MDRTIVGPLKFEMEKEMSEKLYQKMCGLISLYPPDEEFTKYFSKDMFLKSNPKGFFHTMHYLFWTLDPVEFKKRFYWPITDKRSETEFRAATVEYFKHLKAKHQLKSNVTTYLTVMPGGYKFLKFLFDFVSFVVQQLAQQIENKFFDLPHLQMPKYIFDLEGTTKQFGLSKNAMIKYSEELDRNIACLQENVNELKGELNIISLRCNLSLQELTSDNFLKQFQGKINNLYKTSLSKIISINTLNQPLIELNKSIVRFDNSIRKERLGKDKIVAVMQENLSCYSTERLYKDPYMDSQYTKTMLIDSLIKVFNDAYPTIVASLSAANQEHKCNDFVTLELTSLKSQICDIYRQVMECQSSISHGTSRPNRSVVSIPPQAQVHDNDGLENEDWSLMLKLVSTPPIKLEMIENNHKPTMRLPLQCEILSTKKVVPPRSERAAKTYLNKTHNNQLNVIHPHKLWRTASKGSPNQCMQKWRERQLVFGSTIKSVSSPKTPKRNPIKEKIELHAQLPFTPLTSNDCTQIPRKDDKICAVKKVLNASMNFQNLSISPSGRLDALVSPVNVPILKINDLNINEELVVMKCEDTKIISKQTDINDENNANIINIGAGEFNIGVSSDEDAIFDISDSILKDVIF